MTAPPPPPDAQPRAAEPEVMAPLCAVFRRHLRALKQKYTPERAAILDTLISFDGVFQADDVIDTMRAAGHAVSKATVYRTMKLLRDAGIIQQVLVQSEQAHYQLAYGRRPRDLVIRIDVDGAIESVEIPELIAIRDRICRERGLIPTGHRFQIYARSPEAPDDLDAEG